LFPPFSYPSPFPPPQILIQDSFWLIEVILFDVLFFVLIGTRFQDSIFFLQEPFFLGPGQSFSCHSSLPPLLWSPLNAERTTCLFVFFHSYYPIIRMIRIGTLFFLSSFLCGASIRNGPPPSSHLPPRQAPPFP